MSAFCSVLLPGVNFSELGLGAKGDSTTQGLTVASPALTSSHHPRARSAATRFPRKNEEPVTPESCAPPLEETSHAQPLPVDFFQNKRRCDDGGKSSDGG